MNRRYRIARQHLEGVPRASGDEPHQDKFEQAVACMLPASTKEAVMPGSQCGCLLARETVASGLALEVLEQVQVGVAVGGPAEALLIGADCPAGIGADDAVCRAGVVAARLQGFL